MSDDTVSFGPFVANRRDPLHRFSDAAFHRECFDRDPLAKQARERNDETGERARTAKCVVCGEEITSPDDYFAIGFLTDDQQSPVFEFNYVQLHRSHFLSWHRSAEFRRRVEVFQASRDWEGATVKFDPLPAWELPPTRGSLS